LVKKKTLAFQFTPFYLPKKKLLRFTAVSLTQLSYFAKKEYSFIIQSCSISNRVYGFVSLSSQSLTLLLSHGLSLQCFTIQITPSKTPTPIFPFCHSFNQKTFLSYTSKLGRLFGLFSAMWVSSQSTTPFRSPYYCSSCLSFSNSSSKPFRFPLSSLSFFASYGSPQHRFVHFEFKVLVFFPLGIVLMLLHNLRNFICCVLSFVEFLIVLDWIVCL
jgi:hypothetical protein